MSPLDKARIFHAELLEMGREETAAASAEAEIKLAIHHIDRVLNKPGLHNIDIKRARSARSYLRLMLK